ncbi:hypothetical protein RND81_05G167100 [Saponaria officinalis]
MGMDMVPAPSPMPTAAGFSLSISPVVVAFSLLVSLFLRY